MNRRNESQNLIETRAPVRLVQEAGTQQRRAAPSWLLEAAPASTRATQQEVVCKAARLCAGMSAPPPSHSAASNSLRPHALQAARLLCPGGSPGSNTGVGCNALLQGTFPTPGSNPEQRDSTGPKPSPVLGPGCLDRGQEMKFRAAE